MTCLGNGLKMIKHASLHCLDFSCRMICVCSSISKTKSLGSMCRCQVLNILSFCHGHAWRHFNIRKTIARILQCRFYRPTLLKDAHECYRRWICYQQLARQTKNKMPHNLKIVIWYIWCLGNWLHGTIF